MTHDAPQVSHPRDSGSSASGSVLGLNLRIVVLLLVLAVVGWRGRELWLQGKQAAGPGSFTPGWHPVWLLAATVIYLVGWMPSVWFWRRLLRQAGHDLNVATVLRAYFCGHLGKYIPGKASVLVIRAALVHGHGVPASTAAWTATWETLLTMGVGGILGVGLAPWLLTAELVSELPTPLRLAAEHPVWVAAVVAGLSLAGLPMLSRLVSRLTRRLTNNSDLDVSLSTIDALLGALAMSGGWLCHGLSLWWTLEGLGISPVSTCPGSTIAGLTAAVGLATSLGFVAVFAPGGVGIREGVLIEGLVRSGTGQQVAIVAAVLLRAIWLLAELLASAALYYGVATARTDALSPHDEPKD